MKVCEHVVRGFCFFSLLKLAIYGILFFVRIFTHMHINTLLYVLAQWIIMYIPCISYMLKFILKSVHDTSVMRVHIREFNKIDTELNKLM